ncbi:MAG: arginine--tRNA ligase [Candidatus Krumholzibacteriia bacterium]
MVEDLLRKGLLAALEKIGVFDDDLDIQLEKPRDRSHGDLSTNLALVLGGRLDRKPRELAGVIAAEVHLPRSVIHSVEIAGPGFINFRISRGHQIEMLLDLWRADGALERIRTGGNKRINVEFISANPTGPLTAVSARAGAFGMCLVRLLEAVGYDAHAEYYVNDAGLQVQLLGRSLRAHFMKLIGEEVEFPDDAYRGRYMEIMAGELLGLDSQGVQKASSAFNDESFQRIQAPPGDARQWSALPEDESVRCFAKFALMRILGWQRQTCRRFGLRFETWYFESELHETKRIERALDRLTKQGAVFVRDGATWFRATDYGDEQDRVVVRSDGTPTYFMADIAYHFHKFQRGFEHAIDFWGPDHHGYIQRLAGAMAALGVWPEWLEIQIVEQVSFLQDGRPLDASRRKGQVVTMDALVDEVGADAAKFFFLTRKPNSTLEFDLDLARDPSDVNPLSRIRSAHARICGFFQEAESRRIELLEPTAETLGNLESESEWNLVRELVRLPRIIISAAEHREPARLTAYLQEIAGLYNQCHDQCQGILAAKEDRRTAQLHLSLLTRRVIRVVADLIGIDLPETGEKKV